MSDINRMRQRLPRREFVRDLAALLVGGGMATRSHGSNTDPALPRRIGILASGRPWPESWKAGFLRALRNLGYVEGRDVVLHWRVAYGDYDGLPTLAAELVKENVEVILCGTTVAVRAAKRATSSIPIIMLFVGDPVGMGLVASLARPGGNVTGISAIQPKLMAKRLEIVKDAIPGLSRVAFMFHGGLPFPARATDDLKVAAHLLSLEPIFVTAGDPVEFEKAFSEISKATAQAVFLGDDPFFILHRRRILELGSKYKLPVFGWTREFAEDGGLLFYGPDHADLVAQSVIYIDKIFKRSQPR